VLQLKSTDRDIFDTPIEEWHQLPEKLKKTWTEETRKTVQLSIAERVKK